jgi:hypothetical protein
VLTCPSTKCGYRWHPRVPKPKVCPKCHRFLPEQEGEQKEEDHDASESRLGRSETNS